MIRPFVCSLVALSIAGCAATPRQLAQQQAEDQARTDKLAKRLAGFTPGAPVDCLNSLPSDRTSEAIGSTILYKEGSGRIYRNDTSGGCESMEHGDYLVTVSNEGRLCRGDIGRTFSPGVHIATGSCSLGAFVPYTRN